MIAHRDRRYEPRLRCITSVRLLDGQGGEARATNLSPGGVYLQLLDARPVALGTLMHLAIDLADGGAPVRAVGRVVQLGEEVFFSGASLRFLVMSPEDLRRLERHHDRQLRGGGVPIARVPLRPQRARRRRLRVRRLSAARWLPDLEPRAPVIHLGPA